jgi:phenylalanyl-tRNA synthetase beta chain
MKISYNWLKQYVALNSSAHQIAEKLTMVGLAVESVVANGADYLLEFDITSNRPDALSHYGIAREAAAIEGVVACLPSVPIIENGQSVNAVSRVTIENPELCPRYVARVIRGVKVGPSPNWLVERLASVGQRSINNVADITNFVLWEQGHPLHAFDFHKLAENRIVVRTARAGEQLRTLDGLERTLQAEMLVIADAVRPVAVAGVMGGEESEISSSTTDVLLESAYFTPASIRRTARALDLHTEASHRFERGTDVGACQRAADRCLQLIQEIAGGEVYTGSIDVYPQVIIPATITLRYQRIQALTGLVVDPARVEQVLQLLGFTVVCQELGNLWQVTAPSFRIDIGIEEDLVEEVARVVGYDNIPVSLPPAVGAGVYLPGEDRRRRARQTLINQGYNEAITFSWVKPEIDALFRDPAVVTVAVENPIDDNRPQLRSSLLPGLLEALQRNFSFGLRNVRLFESGHCFQAANTADGYPNEYEQLALVCTGQVNELDWQHNQEMTDFFRLKGTVELLLENCGVKDYDFVTFGSSYLHPGQAAGVKVAGALVGWLGQLAPTIREQFKFKQPVYLAELALEKLLKLAPTVNQYTPLPRLQAVTRDISVVVATAVNYQTIVSAIKELQISELTNITLFDIYVGKTLPPGTHSLSLSLRYQPLAESLTDEQINALNERVISLLMETFNAQLRQ